MISFLWTANVHAPLIRNKDNDKVRIKMIQSIELLKITMIVTIKTWR